MRALTVSLLLCSLPLSAQVEDNRRAWNVPVEPFRIIGNVYYVGAVEVTSFLITSPQGHILLDGGYEETAPLILENIRKLGFQPEDVRYLITSHGHLDHAGGLAALKSATGAELWAVEEEIPLLARGGLDDPQYQNQYPYPPVWTDRILRDRQTLRSGPAAVTAHITPGHTQGCTTFTTRAGGKDILFSCSPTAPGYRLVGNARYSDAVEDFRAHFARVRSLPCDVLLASHGSFFGLKEKIVQRKGRASNPFVNPEECRSFFERAEGRIEKLIETQKSTPAAP